MSMTGGLQTDVRFGDRIRYARQFKQLKLAELAKMARCSEGLLSKIENNRAMPSLALLYRIAEKLDTNVAWILTTANDKQEVVLRKSERLSVDFSKYGPAEGTRMERVAPFFDGQLLEVMLMIVAPGGHSRELLEHSGEDAGYVLEGDVEIQIDDSVYHLEAGDAFQFRSERPHGYRNVGAIPARILWINTTQPRVI